jgi:peroxiredoxin
MPSTTAILITLQALILLSLWGILYQVVKQQGRILLRLDTLDRRLANVDGAAETEPGPEGLAVGTPMPPFRLPDFDGKTVSLEDYRGRRVLLIYWGPECGFCELLAPDLARLQGDLRVAGMELVLVSLDDAAKNRTLVEETGLKCPVLLMTETDPLVEQAFREMGTPSGYLLDEQGRVAQRPVVGGEAILALARSAVGVQVHPGRKRLPGERPLSQSKIERDGLKAGTPAPTFRLPDLAGRTVALEDYRGRRVLLVFTDPHCGPCEELAPHLVRLHRQQGDDGPALLMVARGDVEENRRKAVRYGIEFPVVLQERWKLSHQYGIFAVPVAFLIDEEGVITKSVARGVDEIVALVPEGMALGKL